MSLVANEQTKLLANALDRAPTACLTVGIITPLAGYIYGVLDLRPALEQRWTVVVSILGWLVLAAALHPWARRTLRGLRP